MAANQEVTVHGAGAITEDQFRTAVLTRLSAIERKVDALHEYVAKIEKEAHDSMAGLMSPDAMMDLAGKFLGGR